MIRLNGYLHRIGAAELDQCDCGQARETVYKIDSALRANAAANRYKKRQLILLP